MSEKTVQNDISVDNCPKNLTDCIKLLVVGFNNEELDYIKNNDSITTHHVAGRSLRNNWHLWEPATPIVRWFKQNLGISHADDISSTILAAVWATVRKENFDPWEYVKQFKKHWYNMGVDPIGQGPMMFDRMKEVQAEIGNASAGGTKIE
jgi:hypothetical protein